MGSFILLLLFGYCFGWLQQALFLKGADCLGAELHRYFLAVYYHCFGLKIRLPNLLGMTLRKADIAAKLFALTGEFTFLHNFSLEVHRIQGESILVFIC